MNAIENNPGLIVLSSSFPAEPGSISGGGTFVEKLCNELNQKFEVTVIAPYVHSEKKLKPFTEIKVKKFKYFFSKGCNLTGKNGVFENIKTHPLRAFKIPFFLFFQFVCLIRTIKKDNIKICHAHWLLPQALQLVIANKVFFYSNIKILLTIHGSDINKFKSLLFRRLILWILNNVNAITVVSNGLKKDLQEFGFKKNINVFPMGVDINLFRNLNLGKDQNKILYVASFSEKKGLFDLFNALAMLIKDYPKAYLEIVGTGEKSRFLSYAEKINIQKNINWVGKVNNKLLPEYYNKAKIFILPSHSEGLGLVSLESMACECLTLVSELPATKDYLIPSKTGLFTQPKDSISIYNTLKLVFDGGVDVRQITKNSRELVVEKYSWEKVTKNYLSILNTFR